MAKDTPKFKYFNSKDPWLLAEEIPDIDVFFSQIWETCFVSEFSQPNGRAYNKLLSIQRDGYHLWFYFGQKDSFDLGEHIAKRFIDDPTFMVRVNKEIPKWADKLRSFADKLPEEHLSRLSDQQLWKIYEQHDKVHTAYYQWCWIPVGVDMFHDNLTNKLKQYLRTKVTEDKVNEYLVTLTRPKNKSLIQIEQEEFLKLAGQIYKDVGQRKLFRELFKTFQIQSAQPYGLQTHTPEYNKVLEEYINKVKDRIKPSIYKKIQTHYQKYYYIKFMWLGKDGVNTFDYYPRELVRIIGSGIQPAKELSKILSEQKKLIAKKKKLEKKIKIETKWKIIFDQWGDFMVTKIYRRYAQIYTIYRMQPVLKEIAKRKKLSIKEVKLMLVSEIKNALINNKIDRQNLKQRTKLAVYYFEKNKEIVFVGTKAKQLEKAVKKTEIHETTEIRGQVGCVGKATGTVKKIFRPKDMVKMKKGDILVSIATDPDIVPAMKKAAAIVTEQGGVTSHAAIVSREMNIPCVIGTKIATKVLKDGDRVEVDATKGVVKKI